MIVFVLCKTFLKFNTYPICYVGKLTNYFTCTVPLGFVVWISDDQMVLPKTENIGLMEG